MAAANRPRYALLRRSARAAGAYCDTIRWDAGARDAAAETRYRYVGETETPLPDD
jgi:hypothetical protein